MRTSASTTRSIALAGLVALACGDSSSGDAGGSSGESSSESSAGGGIKLDVAAGTATDTAGDAGYDDGCEKVDFLFVIDNSRSMHDEQVNLISSFPGFIAAIEQAIHWTDDYSVMVIDTDRWVFEGCQSQCSLFDMCMFIPEFDCSLMPGECEDVLGAGVVHPTGNNSSEMDCGFVAGQRYASNLDGDLVDKFSCAAKVGTAATTDPERPMQAMVEALSGEGSAGTCNQGFLRDDAILVVTFVTDEDDDEGDGSSGTPAEWKQALVAAKGGNEAAVVVLGLFGDTDQAQNLCVELDENTGVGAQGSERLRTFVESFGDRGVIGSVCSEAYVGFFANAVGIITMACGEFIPEG